MVKLCSRTLGAAFFTKRLLEQMESEKRKVKIHSAGPQQSPKRFQQVKFPRQNTSTPTGHHLTLLSIQKLPEETCWRVLVYIYIYANLYA